MVVIVAIAAVLAVGGNKGSSSNAPPALSTVVTTVTSVTTATQTAVVTQTTTIALSGSITGAGATFPLPQIQQWANDFRDYTGGHITVNYQGVGSGAGQSNFLQKKIDFAGSCGPRTPQNYQQVKGHKFQAPKVFDSIVRA